MTVNEKLTPAQKDAYAALHDHAWRSAYDIGAHLSTLNALVRKGYAEVKGRNALGAFSFPRTTIQYRRRKHGA